MAVIAVEEEVEVEEDEAEGKRDDTGKV